MKIKNLFVLLLTCSAICASAQNKSMQITKDLSPLLKAGNWSLERNVVKASDTTVNIDGKTFPALKLVYTIIHRQPDGSSSANWPYAYFRSIPADMRDWNQFDTMEMKIRGTLSRIDEENLPLVVAILPEKGNRIETLTTIYGVGMLKLARRGWVELSIPIAKMAEIAQISEPLKIQGIKIFVDGSQYRHDDELAVEIADFRLVRETVSRVKLLKMLTPALYTNASVMSVELSSVGNEKELAAGFPVEIRDSNNNKVWETTLPLQKGISRYNLDIASARLKAGKYKLVFSPKSDQTRIEDSFTVIPSPWQ